jgi:hypothetical protein
MDHLVSVLCKDMCLFLVRTAETVVRKPAANAYVMSYVARTPEDHATDRWMDDTARVIWRQFYHDVDRRNAHLMRTSVGNLPLIILSEYGGDYHLVLIAGKNDKIPEDWLKQFYMGE